MVFQLQSGHENVYGWTVARLIAISPEPFGQAIKISYSTQLIIKFSHSQILRVIHRVLAVLRAIGLKKIIYSSKSIFFSLKVDSMENEGRYEIDRAAFPECALPDP